MQAKSIDLSVPWITLFSFYLTVQIEKNLHRNFQINYIASHWSFFILYTWASWLSDTFRCACVGGRGGNQMSHLLLQSKCGGRRLRCIPLMRWYPWKIRKNKTSNPEVHLQLLSWQSDSRCSRKLTPASLILDSARQQVFNVNVNVSLLRTLFSSTACTDQNGIFIHCSTFTRSQCIVPIVSVLHCVIVTHVTFEVGSIITLMMTLKATITRHHG